MTNRDNAEEAAVRYFSEDSLPYEELAVARDAFAKGYLMAIRVNKAAEAAVRRCELIDKLRAGEACSVTIIGENPDFNGLPDQAIECCGAWTGWANKRFCDDSILEALLLAYAERERVEGRQTP